MSPSTCFISFSNSPRATNLSRHFGADALSHEAVVLAAVGRVALNNYLSKVGRGGRGGAAAVATAT